MRRNNVIPKKLLLSRGTRIPYNSGGGVCQFHFKGTVKRAAKCTTHAAKRVEKRCCAFYHPRIKPVLQQFRLLQVAKSCCRVGSTGFANFIDEWSQCDFYFTNLGVILEYLESSIRLSSTWSWDVYTIVRDTRSSCRGPLTWKAEIHDGGHRVNSKL